MPPVGMQRHGQPHVSSSTHPQNMGKSRPRLSEGGKLIRFVGNFRHQPAGIAKQPGGTEPQCPHGIQWPAQLSRRTAGSTVTGPPADGPPDAAAFYARPAGLLAGRWSGGRTARHQLHEQQCTFSVAVPAHGQPRPAGGCSSGLGWSRGRRGRSDTVSGRITTPTNDAQSHAECKCPPLPSTTYLKC